MRSISRYAFYLIIILFFAGLSTTVFAGQETSKDKVKVAPVSVSDGDETPLIISIIEDNAPYSSISPNGELVGYYVDFWNLWATTNNRKIQFSVGSYDDNIQSLIDRKVDFHSGLFKTAKRLKWAEFSIPFDRIDTGIFYLNSRSKKIFDVLDTAGLKVAIQTFSSQHDLLPKKYPEVKFIRVATDTLMANQLLNGELDAIIGEVPYLANIFETKGVKGAVRVADSMVSSNNIYALIPKGNTELVRIINDGIRSIPVEIRKKLEKKWLPLQQSFYLNKIKKTVGLSTAESNVLGNFSELTLGISKFWQPVEYQNELKQHQGISADYIKKLTKELDLNFTFDPRLDWSAIIAGIKSRNIDLLPSIAITNKRKAYLNFTDPYIFFPLVIVTKKNGIYVQGAKDLEGYRVGTSRSSPIHESWSSFYPDIPLITTESSFAGLKLVEDGELDAYIANFATIGPKIRDTFTGLEVAATTPHNLEIAMGVRKGLEELVPILNKWLSTISAEERSKIQRSWFETELREGKSVSDYLSPWIPAALFILIFISYIYRRNRQLGIEIEERKKLGVVLQQAKIDADIANQNKEQFLANMSHEVRTPLNALIGSSHLLSDSGLSEKQQELIASLDYSANSLLLLVNDISDLTKVEMGELTLKTEPFRLDNLIQNIMAQTKINLTSSKLVLEHTIDSATPLYVTGDPHRLGQIITNLLSNAVKFTQSGKIVISVKRILSETSNGKSSTERNLQDEKEIVKNKKTRLQFEVEDTGIGMSIEQQSQLFKAYSQTDVSIARKYGGTGLGLTISKKLCEIMNGDISVESQLNSGTRFTFVVELGLQENIEELKLNQQGQDKAENPKSDSKEELSNKSQFKVASKLANKKVLIVDDNRVNLMIAKKILLKQNMKVSTAQNGVQAVEAIRESIFDIVLMDIQMPEMDGYQATMAIRNDLNQGDLPIIALSANVLDTDKLLSLEAGMNAHLSKPIRVDKLLSTLEHYLS